MLENTPKKSTVSVSPSSSNFSIYVNPDKEIPKVSKHFSSITASPAAQHSSPASTIKMGEMEQSVITEKDLVQNQVVLQYEGVDPTGQQKCLKPKSKE